MATRAKSVCRQSGCPVLLDAAGYCAKHVRLLRSQSDARRGSANDRGYNARWRKARATWLRRDPLCVVCAEASPSRVTPATVVDHKVPHRGDQDLFWDTSNWQSMCKRCHDIKTAREDGGFGNRRIL